MAIRNIVFDLGRVLVDFDPEGYLRSLGFSPETVNTLLQTVFAKDWPLFDRGDYASIADLCGTLCKKYPALQTELRRALVPSCVEIHTLRTETASYLTALKRRGYRIYLLSNLGSDSYEFIRQYPFFQDLDGGVFSYQERVCKPDERIYRILLERYGLQNAETVFLDDAPENVAAAKRLGIHGIVFSGLPAAKAALEALLRQDRTTAN